VTYAGHPLYYYVGDRKAGDVRGQGLNQFGGKWYALRPSGRVIDDD
jgi:predicted lipoprotein with Yx(FWY)xxD motif